MIFNDLKEIEKKEIDWTESLFGLHKSVNLKFPYNVYIVQFHISKKWGLLPSRENVEILHIFTMNPVGCFKTDAQWR